MVSTRVQKSAGKSFSSSYLEAFRASSDITLIQKRIPYGTSYQNMVISLINDVIMVVTITTAMIIVESHLDHFDILLEVLFLPHYDRSLAYKYLIRRSIICDLLMSSRHVSVLIFHAYVYYHQDTMNHS